MLLFQQKAKCHIGYERRVLDIDVQTLALGIHIHGVKVVWISLLLGRKSFQEVVKHDKRELILPGFQKYKVNLKKGFTFCCQKQKATLVTYEQYMTAT